MEDPSIKKRLIDFGSEDHEYDEVEETPEESNNQQTQSPSNINNNSATGTSSSAPAATVADLPPELPPPKQKSVKNSNKSKAAKSKSKSKIPRTSSLASSLSNIAGKSKKQQQEKKKELSPIPPETPPLPASYQQQKAKQQLNGNTGPITESETSPATTSAANNNSNSNSNNNNANSIMGGGVQLSGGLGSNGATKGIVVVGGVAGSGNHRSESINLPSRRPQIQISPIVEQSQKHFQYLTLTVRKDDAGYGMKVSGDNPVFVESVKPGGAAQIAGLVAGDMILKVNGQEVRSEKHPTVVSLIKASTIVELAVKRSHKMVRPTSVGIVPTTPILSGRDRTASITGPQPVDSIKRREMETYKIQTLQKMLEQEKLNLERLKGDTNNPSYKLSEANIRKLREQLRQVGAEDAPTVKYQPTANANNNKNTHNLSAPSHHPHSYFHQHHHQATTPQPQPSHSPAFLSLLPRSLSSLSLGTRKNKIDKDLITSPLNNTTDFLHTHHGGAISPTPPFNMSQSLHQAQQRNSLQHICFQQQQQLQFQQQQMLQQRLKETPKSSKNKNKFAAQPRNLIQEDIPPPLPQRNPPRQPCETNNNTNVFSPISDLDHAMLSPQRNSPQQQMLPPQQPAPLSNNNQQQKKRGKTKTKALSDPKMSTQLFLQMETGVGGLPEHECGGISETDCTPPPLPPRQPGMLEESQHKGSFQNLNMNAGQRPAPNSIETLLNYPLVSTCTAVRDNMAAAFPLSQRPNIVQQLQQHQKQQQQQQMQAVALGQTPQNVNHMNKHRRVVSSPENIHPRHPDRHHKTTSGSWELVEKDDEATPPGTPPPPYLTTHSTSMSTSIEDPHDAATPTGSGIFVDSHHFTPLAGASSPPPHSSRIQAAQSSLIQKEIISMEDEDASDQEGPFIDENGPFNYLQRLLEAENVAFLAVFLNYVLSNSEPAPLLFYLITGLYKEGTAKDMRKWAYEIHSTFLVPRAPLVWYRQDESLAREVDNVLQSEFDKVEILRKVFWKSRKRARDIICEQLREFQQKRTAGLGTIYGPTDAQLTEAKGDKQREQHIFEETLLRKLQNLIEDYEKDLPIEDAKKLALCSALSTVIHRIFITRSHPNSIVDRVHHFVSREKSFKSRLMGKNRKMVVRGHPLVLHQYYEVTHCNHCQNIIWGVSPQGYHCTDCKLNIHRPCSKVLDENCPGPLPQAKRKESHNDNKISKFMDKIRPRTSSDFIANEKRARQEEDMDLDLPIERLNSTSIVRQPSDRRPDATNAGNNNVSLRSNGSAAHNNSGGGGDLQSSFHASTAVAAGGDNGEVNATTGGASGTATSAPAGGAATNDPSALDATEGGKDSRRERLHQQHQQNKSAPVSVNRSESYKERLSHKRSRNSRRKTSDPSLTSRPNDDQPDLGLSNSNYTASSNSSLSSGGGSESPSTSMEQVGGAAAAPIAPHHHHSASMHAHHGPHHTHQHSHQDSFHGSIGSGSSSTNTSFWGSIGGPNSAPASAQLVRQWNFESDEEDDLMEADWSSNVAADMLAALSDAEKKRQEIINEIYQTERSHVRTLKLLDRLFYCPLQESGVLSFDHITLLFPPALLSLRDLHTSFEQKLKQRRVEHNHIVSHVGDLLASMFDGQSGEELREHAAQFCARQQIALEALKEKRRKDEQLQKLLSKAESHKACRRLQLKDLLPTVLQRLTKYPLLFENLYKVTVRVVPQNTAEAEAIQRALESSKKILVDVNQAVKTAEDAHKLQNIQRKLDKSTFDKDEFKNLDLTQYRLIHDGSLTMKKNPSIQLHGLLFENMIVLLTKQDDKYSLKYLQAARNTEVNNKPVSPIMNIDSETLVRQEAADKNSFFLIKTKTSQMLELRAPSSSECKTWFKHISDAAEQYKPRSKNASQEPVDDPAIATIPHSNTKESLELAPERPPPISATATVTTTPLAPMMPPATVTSAVYQNVINDGSARDVHMRNGRRESTPTPATDNTSSAYNHRQRLSQNDLLSTSVNRTNSTRSWGEPAVNEPGVTLRHTQSARQAGDDVAVHNGASGGASNRNSASIVCSNNSNNTRTLMQSSAPLVEPTAIQISISPAHTAEPVLTPAEKLRRLDSAIRDGLYEKQKIICDMFRLPVEHFHEIVDIAAMPEAPKDSADIALAAYAQVQSLTEVVNEYMHATPEQVISAVSTSVCDRCNEKQRLQRPVTPLNSSASASSASAVTQISAADQQPPPLPPPNKQHKQSSGAQAQQQTPTPTVPKLQTTASALEEAAQIHEDDDGYCEIDELRLPALPPLTHAELSKPKSASPPPPLPPPAGSFKTPPPPPPPPANANKTAAANAPAELVKRQSTVSADSIPEESADELIQAMDDGEPQKAAVQPAEVTTISIDKETETKKETEEVAELAKQLEDAPQGEVKSNDEESEKNHVDTTRKARESKDSDSVLAGDEASESELKAIEGEKADKEARMEINDNSVELLRASLATLIDCATQTVPLIPAPSTVLSNGTNGSCLAATATSATQCGPNRIQHANSLEPSVPCYALNSIVSALNAQISLLLPKISERDNERERLRKENQHLRELLNAMHERQRVEEKLETPNDITTKAAELEELFDADVEEVDSDFIAMLSGGSKANSSNISSTTVEAEN